MIHIGPLELLWFGSILYWLVPIVTLIIVWRIWRRVQKIERSIDAMIASRPSPTKASINTLGKYPPLPPVNEK